MSSIRDLTDEVRLLRAEVRQLRDDIQTRPSVAMIPAGINPEEMRPTYTPAQFAAEILLGVRTAEWVCDQIRVRKIRSLTPRPYRISRGEALRWLQVFNESKPKSNASFRFDTQR